LGIRHDAEAKSSKVLSFPDLAAERRVSDGRKIERNSQILAFFSKLLAH